MKPSRFLAIAVLFFSKGLLAAPATQPVVSIESSGAVGDGKTVNTLAIQKAIDGLSASGGGTLEVPKGVFLTGSLFLKAGVNLYLDEGGTLKSTAKIEDFPKSKTRIEGHFEDWPAALINADGLDHLLISGTGTLDGSGQPFWAAFRAATAKTRSTKNLDVPRPRMMLIQNSSDVHITGIHLLDSGFWNIHLYRCHDVTLDGLTITAGARSPSTDGMDIDSSHDITVSHCTIAVNDDCIAMKGSKGPFAMKDESSPPVENIHIVDCTFNAGGGITCGSEATIVRHVLVEHCTMSGPGTRGMALVRLKLRPDTPQDYSDLTFRDITFDGVGSIINVAPWKQYFDLMGQPAPVSTIHGVTVSEVHGKFGSFGSIQGNPGDVIDGIAFKNIDVQLTTGTPKFVGVKNLVMDNVKVNSVEVKAP